MYPTALFIGEGALTPAFSTYTETRSYQSAGISAQMPGFYPGKMIILFPTSN